MAFSYSVSSKFKTLKSYVDDICNRLDEQDEIIAKQASQIEYLNGKLASLSSDVEKIYMNATAASSPAAASPVNQWLPKKITPDSGGAPPKKQKIPFKNKPSAGAEKKFGTPPPKKQVSPKRGTAPQELQVQGEGGGGSYGGGPPILEQHTTFPSLTFIPMSINPFNSRNGSSSSVADVTEIDSDEELDQELALELQELDLKDESRDNKEIKEEDE
jgi:hypothetical protein